MSNRATRGAFASKKPSRMAVGFCVCIAASLLFGCEKTKTTQPEPTPSTSAIKKPDATPSEGTLSYDANKAKSTLGELAKEVAPRVVAIGDVHGDIAAARKALVLAGAVDGASGDWVGGSLVVVQTGDQLDRGDDERAILDWFERLRRQAKEAGGAFHSLNGNHETMNVMLDFRYVTEGGFAAFSDVSPAEDAPIWLTEGLKRLPGEQRGRAAAFAPGGRYARVLAEQPVVIAVGSTVFAHGGVLPEHVRSGLPALQKQTRSWMLGETQQPPAGVANQDAVVWTRAYSTEPEDCRTLREALRSMGMVRMVVGHTVQKSGIASACDEQVWRIDVGMAAHYGGQPAVLEIRGDEVRPISASP